MKQAKKEPVSKCSDWLDDVGIDFCKYVLAIAQILLFLVLIREKFVGALFIFEQKTSNSLI